jgi:methionyl-tRNA formyltransferase
MKVIILTSSIQGTASHHLKYLLKEKNLTISMVVYNEGKITKKYKYIAKKLRKMARIGLLGTINGIRMRKWFGENISNYTEIGNIVEICRINNIPFYNTASINSAKTVDLFNKSRADIGLSLGNGYIGMKVFNIPRYGMINIHHEILPEYQNGQSVIWQIYNGSSITGYAIHKIDKGIDSGAILLKETVPIHFEKTLADTVSHTLAILYDKSALGLIKVLADFSTYNNQAVQQGAGKSYTTPTIRQYFKILKQFKKLSAPKNSYLQ